jgi:hypothetical protein
MAALILSCSGANSVSTWIYRVIAARSDDIAALAFQHVGTIAEVGGLDLDFGEVDILLRKCGTGKKHGDTR